MAFSTSDMVRPKEQVERWDREVELQKSYGLSPSEAVMLVAKENGLTASEIAEMEGLNVQTVKNTISRARKKVTGESDMEFYISRISQIKGDTAMARQNVILVIANLCKEMGYDVRVLTHVVVISNVKKSVAGDKQWFASNVERYVDMYGTRNDMMAVERAKRIKDIYDKRMSEQGITETKFGHVVIKYYLDKNYIPYDVYDAGE